MKACSSCPTKHHAETLEELAEVAQKSRLFRIFAPVLRKRAAVIREAGCHFWQIAPNIETDVGYVETCIGANFERFCRKYGQDILLASDTVQADRSEQKKALDAVETAAREMGLAPIMEHLAQLGLRAAVGHRIEEQRREIEAGEETS